MPWCLGLIQLLKESLHNVDAGILFAWNTENVLNAFLFKTPGLAAWRRFSL